jgi:hypothetical protein
MAQYEPRIPGAAVEYARSTIARAGRDKVVVDVNAMDVLQMASKALRLYCLLWTPVML